MGSALTYARRYALFTLVGIAGEDDLDAPDLIAPMAPASKSENPAGNPKGRLNGGPGRSTQQQVTGSTRTKAASSATKPNLEPEASAALRDQLTAELTGVSSADDAANWAHRVLGAKNTLKTADAERVEQAFREKLASIAADAVELLSKQTAKSPASARSNKRRRASAIDKAALILPVPRRIRDREHVKAVAKQPCLVCGRRPADAHHLRFAQSAALGRKVSDEFTVPLCRGHHREVHRCGDEAAWWRKTGINPGAAARVLWLKSHPVPLVQQMRKVRTWPASTWDQYSETKPIWPTDPQ
jgi:hypothetical protein